MDVLEIFLYRIIPVLFRCFCGICGKICYIYKNFWVENGKKDAKGRIPVKVKSAKDLRIPVWDNTKLSSGKIKWYPPNTKLAWYDNKKGYLELYYPDQGWY